ncbi:protein transporter TIM8 NDAI_0J02940 [Naumovozyma dairenensis CBS 421]|uniref:Mitochondrial import inner membrane translocase subunit n=1 Tax=Naumovozyma dairenensis (strain ATCC 10597 / BCRC 20456 / CBS 421 / NBRC 0211 / NRRL Y-12639) TaxID=1071378 RepID=G0WHA8_NAUDC|nr:hypothetical protein NDAI_0J02940 [Naumovozyma dairenensis CBS 421]CCD27186.1 hypothetical protein NDAI_0J02940 [Naumovozyma dairenensis CBS 421]
MSFNSAANTTASSLSAESLSSLDANSKKDISTFIESENAKQKVQMSIHQLTNTCFKSCITNVSDPDLSSQDQQCLANCVNRFLDTNIRLVKGLQNIQ